MLKKIVRVLVPALTIFALWYVGSVINPDALSSPIRVLELAFTYTVDGGPPPYPQSAASDLAISLYRVILATFIALFLSVTIGILMGFNDKFESVVSDWIPLWLTLPDVVVILVVMIILGFTSTSVVVAVVLSITPFGVVNMWEGIRDLDSNLVEMAYSFDSSQYLNWRYIYFPHLASYIFASFRYIFGMVWKVVIVAEAFGVNRGIGAIFRTWYNLASVENILAYFVLFVFVMLIIEYVILKEIERRAFAWKN